MNRIRDLIKTLIYLVVPVILWQSICAAGTVTVTDQAGRQVRVEQPVNRVVTTFTPATFFALCADLADILVGASRKDRTASVYGALIDRDDPPVFVGNRTAGLSLETIFSLKPDLVIMYGQKDGVRLADRLTAMGAPAVVIRPESMADMKKTLDLLGRASGRRDHTDKVIRAMAEVEALVTERVAAVGRPRVYYAGSQLLSTVSGAMLQNEMIRIAGGINVSKETSGFFVTVSPEQLMAWNPEVIIASDRLSREAEARLNTPEFSSLRAVTDRRIFRVPAETYWDFPSPLAMAGVLWMAGILHPDLFPADTVRTETNRLYDTIFGSGFSRRHPRVTGQSPQK